MSWLVVITLVYLNMLQLVFVDRIKAERASLPVSLFFKCEVLEDAGPAVNVAALGDFGGNHLAKVFHTDGALDFLSVHHVVSNSHDILPIH